MPFYRVDNFFPIIITQHIGEVTDGEWTGRLERDVERMQGYAARGEKILIIYDRHEDADAGAVKHTVTEQPPVATLSRVR